MQEFFERKNSSIVEVIESKMELLSEAVIHVLVALGYQEIIIRNFIIRDWCQKQNFWYTFILLF